MLNDHQCSQIVHLDFHRKRDRWKGDGEGPKPQQSCGSEAHSPPPDGPAPMEPPPGLSRADGDIRLASDIRRFRLGDLTLAELKKRWPREHTSHRAMLDRRAKVGAVVHASFREFPDFLIEVGPCPGPGFTLDRLDPRDPEYGPGKVRWADKRTQANNRRNTAFAYVAGMPVPAAELARITGEKPDTVRKRIRRGGYGLDLSAKPQVSRTPTATLFSRMGKAELECFDPFPHVGFSTEGLAHWRAQWENVCTRRPKEWVLHYLARRLGETRKYYDTLIDNATPDDETGPWEAKRNRTLLLIEQVNQLRRGWRERYEFLKEQEAIGLC